LLGPRFSIFPQDKFEKYYPYTLVMFRNVFFVGVVPHPEMFFLPKPSLHGVKRRLGFVILCEAGDRRARGSKRSRGKRSRGRASSYRFPDRPPIPCPISCEGTISCPLSCCFFPTISDPPIPCSIQRPARSPAVPSAISDPPIPCSAQ
jgi:hypothetical protein